MSDTQQQDAPQQADSTSPEPDVKGEEQQEQTFTQADVDRIVRERVKREREKYADYDDLRAKADQARTVEERVADLERQLNEANTAATKARIAAEHGITPEDAELFLTGTDEETLTAQAKRLAERESERKRTGNVAPKEGANPRPEEDQDRELVRGLFGGTT